MPESSSKTVFNCSLLKDTDEMNYKFSIIDYFLSALSIYCSSKQFYKMILVFILKVPWFIFL